MDLFFILSIKQDPIAEDYKILKFFLHSSVENTILHGILPKQENRVILITSKVEEDKLLLSISDNGVGTDKSLDHTEDNVSSSMMGSINDWT